MPSDSIDDRLSAVKVPVVDPQFYARAFTVMSKEVKASLSDDPIRSLFVEEYDSLSRRADRSGIQDSSSIRNVLRTRRLAELLIDEKGDLNAAMIPKAIAHLKTHLYSLGPDRQHDSRRQEHILRTLEMLQTNKEVVRLLRGISKPYAHRHAEQIIRETLDLAPNTSITDTHARRAALSALFCYLRQNVGSCFATAPAIIIHNQMPEQFLTDINELMNTGRLKRTFGGIEYAVPLSISWGAGDLKRMLVLTTSELEQSEISLSPGLMAALETIGLVDKSLPLKQKAQQVKSETLKVLKVLAKGGQPYFATNVDEIIRFLILEHLKITEKELLEYESRPRGMIAGGLMLQVSAKGVLGGGKSQALAQFAPLFLAAQNAFKTLADNALLKTWEFSLASFAETKAQFARWNLYSSLGLSAQEKDGIGFCIYEVLQRKLENANEKVREHQFEYEQVYTQVKYLEARIQRASTEKEIQWMKAEYQTKLHEFYLIEELRDTASDQARRISTLYDTLVNALDELFPRYFQEVYDADMHEVAVSQYDDSPAGFRLLYKYGRANTSQWTFIHTPDEFIEALSAFFTSTETELASRDEFKGLQQDLSEIITAVVTHVKTKEFLESAFYRMAQAHHTPMIKDPLEHLDKIEKKPWAYTSGGTMGSLVSCYFRLEQPPTEAGRWVENPMELLVFLADTLKQIPPKLTDPYAKQSYRGLLIHSPTHAFLLKPGYPRFLEAWQNEAYSYTWIRDQLVKPMERNLEITFLDESMMAHLVQRLLPSIPINYRHYFSKSVGTIHGTMSPKQFRQHLVETMDKERGLQIRGTPVLQEEQIDSLLYKALPLFPIHQTRERLNELFAHIPGVSEKTRQALLNIWDQSSAIGMESVGSADMLQNIAKALLCLHLGATSSTQDYHALVAKAARACSFSLPEPILFADSNWIRDDFGFIVNPGTGKLDLWRFDATASTGSPMASWQQWLDGSRKDLPWGVYTRPYEYTEER
ncbi:MAG: hypothetical protein LLG04_03110 [Parachlamydia sp.]|nr:hypothetical protein [Parachlamydia sp.]